MADTYKIFQYIDDLDDAYSTPITRVQGLVRNPKEVIKTVEFYSNSQYLTGNKDELGREKPFYNVGNYRVTVAKVATDLDVKDIRFEPDSLKYKVQTMIYNKELYKYLKDCNFSLTLNEMGLTRPKYGGVLVKRSMEDGKLKIDVVDWTNVDFDPADILGGTLIETFWLQPSELSAKSDVWNEWDDVSDVLKAHQKANKNKPAKIMIKEISGEFPESFYPGNDNKDFQDTGKYKRMCFYIAVIDKKKFMLYAEYEKEINYKYLPWEKIGNGLGKGVWEDGFESQTWTNDSMISIKNALELMGKVIITTDSQKISGNAIVGVDNGHIFQVERGSQTSALNLNSANIGGLEKVIELWNTQYDRISSTYDANTGEAPTANTPYSQTALLNQVANSPFEYRREEWGIFLNEILNDWVLPYLKKKILSEHILVADYDNEELEAIDEAIATIETNRAITDWAMKDDQNMLYQEDQQAMMDKVKNDLKTHGSKREITVPEGFLDVKGKITANITGELKNKAAMLQSLDSIFKTVISTFNPATGQYAALQDPTLAKIFGSIVEMSGIPLSSASLRPASGGTAPVQQQDLSAVAPAAPMAPTA